jgi:hypothetical protein
MAAGQTAMAGSSTRECVLAPSTRFSSDLASGIPLIFVCTMTINVASQGTGRISISRRELKAIIRQEGGKGGFIAFVWFPE